MGTTWAQSIRRIPLQLDNMWNEVFQRELVLLGRDRGNIGGKRLHSFYAHAHDTYSNTLPGRYVEYANQYYGTKVQL